MLKLCLSIILAALLQNVQCRPADIAANGTAVDQAHVFVGNTSAPSNNSKVDAFVSQLGNVEKQIDETLNDVSPFFNFLFDSDNDGDNPGDDGDCVDQMIIQLVPQYMTPEEIKKTEDKIEDLKIESEIESLESFEDSDEDDDFFSQLFAPRTLDSDSSSSSSESSSSSSESSDSENDSDTKEEPPFPYDDYYPKYKVAK